MRSEPIGHRFWWDGGRRYEVALVWDRLSAALLDWCVAIFGGVVFGFVIVVVYSWWGHQTGYVGSDDQGGLVIWIGGTVISVAIVHLLFSFTVARSGTTPGHKLIGLRVRNVNGEGIGLLRATLRQILGSSCISTPFLVVLLALLTSEWTAGVIWFFAAAVLSVTNHVAMFRDGLGQGWHDRLAGTVVVKDRGVD